MNLREWVIGFVLFNMVLLGVFAFGGGLASEYDIEVNENYNDSYNRIDRFSTELRNIQNKTNPSDPDDLGDGDSSLLYMARGAGSTIRLMLDIPLIMNDIIIDMASDYGIPKWFVHGILIIIGMLVMAAIAAAVLRSSNI